MRELIYHYYDELFVRIRTNEWKLDWFMYQTGLFQGCPLSVVFFLIVFSLLLDFNTEDKRTPELSTEEYQYQTATEGIR